MTRLIKIDERPDSRRERAKQDKWRRILRASRELFSSHGFEQTTVQQIADAADIAVGTLFLYVADKGELLLLLYYEALELKFAQAERALNGNAMLLRAIMDFFGRFIPVFEQELELSRIFMREFLFHKGNVRAKLDEQTARMLASLQARIIRAQKEKQIGRSVDPEVAALHLYALYHATLAFYLAECLPAEKPNEILEPLLKSFWRGLRHDRSADSTTP
jgi:AcrR family transcriptional regulator